MFWTPTLSLFDRMAHEPDPADVDAYIDDRRPDGFVSETVQRSARAWASQLSPSAPDAPAPPWERTVELTGRAHRAGVRLSLGTDAGCVAVFHGLAVHRELELLVRAGLTPREALVAATSTAAAKIGVEERLGTVEVGKEADLLILREDPLDDIRNTRAIDMVIKRERRSTPAICGWGCGATVERQWSARR